MNDFKFVKDSVGHWVISAPKRNKRPNQDAGVEPPCPFEFIDGKIGDDFPIYSLNEVHVINNLYPFAPIHEIVIHSNDHRKNFGDLDYEKAEDIFKVFQLRHIKHKKNGQVLVFHNQGKKAGESLPHPHTQITVTPSDIELDVPPLRYPYGHDVKTLNHFAIFCPANSKWPDEVWVSPKRRSSAFADASPAEIKEISFILSRLVQIFTIRHGLNFPFNFYISPGNDWYLRLVPRLKILGGFEVATDVFVNTQDPHETFKFIRDNFDNPNFDKIKELHLAEYSKSV